MTARNYPFLFLALFCSCIMGILFFAYTQGWFLWCYPAYSVTTDTLYNKQSTERKKITLYFWHRHQWHTETNDIIWPEEIEQQLLHLITHWLTIGEQEKFLTKKTSIQSALRTPAGKALVSFDQQPFTPEQSTFEKWLWIESLLKTVRENPITIPSITFLVCHKPLLDPHLDFSNPWPTAGFFNHT